MTTGNPTWAWLKAENRYLASLPKEPAGRPRNRAARRAFLRNFKKVAR